MTRLSFGSRRMEGPARQRGVCSRDRAFTLIEMLVVITIISILAGLSLAGVVYARRMAQERAVKADIQMLCARIETFRNAFGYYPPSSLIRLKVKVNGINDANESLFAYLQSKKHGGPFAEDLKEDRWENADGDSLTPPEMKIIASELDWIRGTNACLEHVDYYHSPFVYIPASDYGKKFKYQTIEGEFFEVEAAKNPTTGTYCAPTTFQLWSLGADGKNQNGGGDDIVSWK